jgi:prevent-host-death family protein
VNAVNILQAKSSLSKLVAAVESGEEKEIVIARNGKPVARLVPLESRPPVRLGLLKGKYRAPKNIDAVNPEILKLFEIEEQA